MDRCPHCLAYVRWHLLPGGDGSRYAIDCAACERKQVAVFDPAFARWQCERISRILRGAFAAITRALKPAMQAFVDMANAAVAAVAPLVALQQQAAGPTQRTYGPPSHRGLDGRRRRRAAGHGR